MYTGLLHTHTLVVVLFLLLYLVKTGLLVGGKTDQLAKVVKITRIPEMVISFLFLATGLGMLFTMPSSLISVWLIIKLVFVFASIPLAIIGFKKQNKALAAVSFVLLVGAYGLAEIHKGKKGDVAQPGVAVTNTGNAVEHGKSLYAAYNCAACHGEDGALQAAGAKNLQTSTLTNQEVVAIITNGKNAMAAYGDKLSQEEIAHLAEYVQTLRK